MSKTIKRNNRKNNRRNKNKNKPNGGSTNGVLRQVLGPQVAGAYTTGCAWVKLGMKYSDTFSTTLVAGAVNDQVYRANSIFDPDRTNTGHQPLEFDQYMLLYNRYHVYAVSWHITSAGAADAYHMATGIINGTETFTSATDFRTFREGPMVRDYTSSYGSPSLIARDKKPLYRFNGISMKAYMTDDRFGSQMITNPSEIIDLHIMHYNPSANTVLIHWQIDLKFHCVVHDPLLADPSSIRRRCDWLYARDVLMNVKK